MNEAFSDVEWHALVEYVRYLQDNMRLHEWRVVLCDETPSEVGQGEHALAYVEPNKNHRSARIYLSREFLSLSLEEKREVMIHELLHVHFRDLAEVFASFEEPIGIVVYNTVMHMYEHHMELFIQELALLLALHYDLPPEELKP